MGQWAAQMRYRSQAIERGRSVDDSHSKDLPLLEVLPRPKAGALESKVSNTGNTVPTREPKASEIEGATDFKRVSNRDSGGGKGAKSRLNSDNRSGRHPSRKERITAMDVLEEGVGQVVVSHFDATDREPSIPESKLDPITRMGTVAKGAGSEHEATLDLASNLRPCVPSPRDLKTTSIQRSDSKVESPTRTAHLNPRPASLTVDTSEKPAPLVTLASAVAPQEAVQEERQVEERTGDDSYLSINLEKHQKFVVKRVISPSKESPISKKIHILGTGAVGRFIAHSLVGITESPPVTLLLHRPLLVQKWYDEGRAIRLIRGDKIDSRFGFNIESSAGFAINDQNQRVLESHNNLSHSGEPSDIIENLIVTTEGSATISALLAIKRRLRSYSTICFIQGGLGVLEQVNSVVFPRPTYRPSYMLGNNSHDLQSTGSSFTALYRRPGTIYLTMVPPTPVVTGRARKMDFGWTPRSKYLLRTLCRTPELQATGLLKQDFFKMQLEKLAINSVIGPLSVINYCTNDQLLYNFHISQTLKLLLKEISSIVRQLPEVSNIPDINHHFSAERLEFVVMSVIGKTGKNRTSMLQAVMDGRKTNIDFYNGYLLGRAAELGIDCPNLEMVVAMVKGKQQVISKEKSSYIPFTDK